MAANTPNAEAAPSLRERLREETRQIIIAAFADCLEESEIDKVTFSDIAARAGVGERTVYRHFPTRDDLMRALYVWLSEQTDLGLALPQTEADLTSRLAQYFAAFDARAAVMKAAVITPQGYEMRATMAEARSAAFNEAVGSIASELSVQERQMAAAVIQHLHSATAWLTLRDCGLDGETAARACTWAIAALLRDIHARGPTPLDTTEGREE